MKKISDQVGLGLSRTVRRADIVKVGRSTVRRGGFSKTKYQTGNVYFRLAKVGGSSGLLNKVSSGGRGGLDFFKPKETGIRGLVTQSFSRFRLGEFVKSKGNIFRDIAGAAASKRKKIEKKTDVPGLAVKGIKYGFNVGKELFLRNTKLGRKILKAKSRGDLLQRIQTSIDLPKRRSASREIGRLKRINRESIQAYKTAKEELVKYREGIDKEAKQAFTTAKIELGKFKRQKQKRAEKRREVISFREARQKQAGTYKGRIGGTERRLEARNKLSERSKILSRRTPEYKQKIEEIRSKRLGRLEAKGTITRTSARTKPVPIAGFGKIGGESRQRAAQLIRGQRQQQRKQRAADAEKNRVAEQQRIADEKQKADDDKAQRQQEKKRLQDQRAIEKEGRQYQKEGREAIKQAGGLSVSAAIRKVERKKSKPVRQPEQSTTPTQAQPRTPRKTKKGLENKRFKRETKEQVSGTFRGTIGGTRRSKLGAQLREARAGVKTGKYTPKDVDDARKNIKQGKSAIGILRKDVAPVGAAPGAKEGKTQKAQKTPKAQTPQTPQQGPADTIVKGRDKQTRDAIKKAEVQQAQQAQQQTQKKPTKEGTPKVQTPKTPKTLKNKEQKEQSRPMINWKDPNEVREYHRRWQKENPEKVKASRDRQRQKRRQNQKSGGATKGSATPKPTGAT